MPGKCFEDLQAVGPIGDGKVAISPPKRTQNRFMMRYATCWPPKWVRPTHLNGSTLDSTGPTGLRDPLRDITESIRKPIRLCAQPRHMSSPRPMPVLFSQFPTIW